MPQITTVQHSTHIATFFKLGWELHPIYSTTCDYPPVMKELMSKKNKEEGYSRSRLPSFTKEEIEMVKGEFSSEQRQIKQAENIF